MGMPIPTGELKLESNKVGPLPIINHFLAQLQVDRFIAQHVPQTDRRCRLEPAVGLGILLRNLLVAREPLYNLCEWSSRFEPSMLRLPPGSSGVLNDDRIGRCLDQLFRADRSALITSIVAQAAQAFQLKMDELHNDSTTITVSGQYANARGQPEKGVPTHRITFGHNKDHRPDLKQLLYILTTTADGTVPIWCGVDHGNTTDDQTHITTWNALHQLLGHADFLYVADSKLCTKENMRHIESRQGRFLTVLPKTRSESAWFRQWIQSNQAPNNWEELLRRQNSRRRDGPDEVYRGIESPLCSGEGYRIFWIWSSQKALEDRASRDRRIQQALDELDQLHRRMQSPRSRLRDRARAEALAAAILARTDTKAYVSVTIEQVAEPQFTQATPGRPGKNTQYIRKDRFGLTLHSSLQANAIQFEDRLDGVFPLILNDTKLSIRDALVAYKHQPSLEKRHEQLKTVLEVMPVSLKSHSRIEALLFLFFLALLVQAIIERELRRRMAAEGVIELPLYPEARLCKRPTADRICHLFEEMRCHHLLESGSVQRSFWDPLSQLQEDVLRLLGMSSSAFTSASRTG